MNIYIYTYIYIHIYIYICIYTVLVYANIISILHIQYTYDAVFLQPSLGLSETKADTTRLEWRLEVWALFWGVGCASKIVGILEPTNLSTKNWHKTKRRACLKGKSSCEELFGWRPSICSCNPVSENYRTYLPTVPKVHVVETCNDVLIGTCNSVNRFLYILTVYILKGF